MIRLATSDSVVERELLLAVLALALVWLLARLPEPDLRLLALRDPARWRAALRHAEETDGMR